MEAIVAMLADDVRLAMPPAPECYQGRAAVRTVLATGPIAHRWRLRQMSASGQLAFGAYRWLDDRRAFVGEGVDVLTIRDSRIATIDAYLVSDLEPFGLPSTILA